jgi:putative phosphoribosyl transferase
MMEQQAMHNGAEHSVAIQTSSVTLAGVLAVPAGAGGVVLFAHGSGSSRHSPRNRTVARMLGEAGLATLLFDLLTLAEDEEDRITHRWRFDIPLLAERLADTTEWLAQQPSTAQLAVGYFGASTGAGAALIAAADPACRVRAVVSRGGRPDLAGAALRRVQVPTLLIVGERDPEVIRLNEQAQAQLGGASHLVIVPGATHLFEEEGALEEVARLARDWFVAHLTSVAATHDVP